MSARAAAHSKTAALDTRPSGDQSYEMVGVRHDQQLSPGSVSSFTANPASGPGGVACLEEEQCSSGATVASVGDPAEERV